MSVIKYRDKDGQVKEIAVIKGEQGPQGDTGATGKDGTSVSVTTVTESTADGGSNVVYFSDGKTLTVKNGSKGDKGDKGDTGSQGEQGLQGVQGEKGATGEKGADGISATHTWNGTTLTVTSASGTSSADLKGEKGDKGAQGLQGQQGPAGNDGYTPIKGVDYYTEEDRAELEEYLSTELAKRGQLKPEFANSIAECTDTNRLYVLPDGLIYAYMLTEVSKEPTNLLPLATDTDRKTVYNGKGFKENTRLSSSSGGASDATGVFATGFIPVKAGDVLYFKNMAWSNLSQKCYILAFNSSNAVTGKLEIQGSTASPAPTSPVTLDSATFGSGFNAIRISASDISTDTVITVNEELEGGTTTDYGWTSTGHAFVPADYEDRIVDLENAVKDLEVSENNAVIPLVEFDYDHNLADVSAMVSSFQVASHDLRKQKTVPTVYSLFDELVEAYSDYVSKSDVAELVGLAYPEYANGITTAGTYAVTPAYKTYMYKLSYSNAYSGNESRHKHKRMFLIGGLDGSEYVPPYNLYILAKRLCEDFNEDSSLFKLRGSFDIYIVPCLNGYGLYHGTKYNANGIAITRNMPTKAWVEANEGDPNYYTGSVAGSEFETQLVMKLTEYIKPDVAIDHHSYGYLPTQFYSELPKEDFAKLAYQSLVDCSMAFTKNLPQYFGTKFKLFQDREGATSAPAQVANVRGTQTWWDENGVTFGGLIEASVGINYLNGELAGTGQDLYGNDTFSVAEYTLRNQLLRYAEYVLNGASWNGTTSSDLKGDKGDPGAQGPQGDKGDKGDNYILTPADKAEIAEQVESATIVPPPLYVDSLDKMTDTNKVYVLSSTGHIFAYMDTTVKGTVTEKIEGTADNPYQVGRFSSNGTLSTDVSDYVITPYIDLTKAEYVGKTIQLHLEGLRYVTETNEQYVQSALFKTDKSVLNGRAATCLDKNYGILTTIANLTAKINGTTSATLTITIPPSYNGTAIGYMRFCAKGVEADSNIYVTYEGEVSGGQWVDTGTTYAPTLTETDKQEIAEDVAAMIDTQLLTVVGDGAVTV